VLVARRQIPWTLPSVRFEKTVHDLLRRFPRWADPAIAEIIAAELVGGQDGIALTLPSSGLDVGEKVHQLCAKSPIRPS
jgi:hypothetical protein